MKKYIYGGLAVVVIVLGYFLWSKNVTIAPTAVVPLRQTIKLGIMLPTSGDFGALGEGVGRAATMAINDYKATHQNVDIVVVQDDDKFDVKTGVGIYTKMTSLDKVDALFMISTPVLDALHEKMTQDGLPVVSVGLQNVGIAHDNIFQTTPDANAQIVELASYLQTKTSYKKLAILYGNSQPALLGFHDAFKKTYTKETIEFIVNTQDDAKTTASKVKASGADAVVIMNMPSTGAYLAKELKKNGTRADYYFDLQLTTGLSEYKKILGDITMLNGVKALHLTEGDEASFIAKYKNLYGTDPTPYADYGYDSVKALLDGYNKDKAVWVTNISNVNFVGSTGEMKFDSNGVRVQSSEVWVMKDGKLIKE
jgi:branched-chain amino acid transport system substrate-binding protein